MADMHRVSVHDPGHDAVVGADIRRGHVTLRADDIHQLRRVAPCDAFEFEIGQQLGIADDAALRAAERNIYYGAFPCHPRRQRPDLIQGHVRSVADSALSRTASNRMLHTIAGEDFNPAIVQLDRDVDRDLLGGALEYFADAIVEPQSCGGFIKSDLGGSPRIRLLIERRRADWHESTIIPLLDRLNCRLTNARRNQWQQ